MSLLSLSRTGGRRSVAKLVRPRSPATFISSLTSNALQSTQERAESTQTFNSPALSPLRNLRGYTKPAYEYRRDEKPLGTQLEWDEVTPTRYERAVDAIEKLYCLQESVMAHHGVHHWMMSNGIKIQSESPTLTEDVKQAWIALRYKHPGLHSQIEGDRWVYEVPDEEGLEDWLSESFHVHDTHKTSRELFPEVETRPLKRAVLHYLPRTQEILLASPHTHFDGIGILLWYENFLQALADGPKPTVFGGEGKNLLPALTPIVPIQPYTDAQKNRWDAYMANEWLSDKPTACLKAEKSPVPGKGTIQWLRFSESDTQAIINSVKSHGITVGSAAQAAVSLAARAHGGDMNVDSAATMTVYDAREYISPKYARTDLVGAHTFATPINFKLGNFVETAHNAKSLMVSEKADKYAITISPYFTVEFPRLLHSPKPEGQKQSYASNAFMSSIGTLDRIFKREYHGPAGVVKLCDLWIALDMMTPDVLVAFWTFQGQLTIQTSYNEAYFPEASIERFQRLLKETLEKGLEIKLNPEMMKPGMEYYGTKRKGYEHVQRTGETPWESEPCIPIDTRAAATGF